MRKSLTSRFTFLVAVGLLLAACGTGGEKSAGQIDDPGPVEAEKSPETKAGELYIKATDSLDAGEYEEAARLYEELERQYPYSEWATKSQLMAAYAVYLNLDYSRAIAALDRFIELHPGHQDVDYAFYLKALSHYEQISGVKRDQSRTREALEALNVVIRRFPNSKYARDARFKRDLALNHLAGKEMEIGRYYLKRNQVNAAINRFKNVIENYQTTTHVPEALHRLVEAYRIIGLNHEARKVAAVLGYNYPGSKWYEYSYRLFDEQKLEEMINRKSWVDTTIETLFAGEEDDARDKVNDASSGQTTPASGESAAADKES